MSALLGPFRIPVGPNAGGKTSFPDVIGFLSDLVSVDLDEALIRRTTNPEELLFRHQGSNSQLAVEVGIPDELRTHTAKSHPDIARCEICIGLDESDRQFEIKAETFLLEKSEYGEKHRRTLFPMPPEAPESLLIKGRRNSNRKTVVNKVPGGNDNFYSEAYRSGGKGWTPSFKLGPQRSTLRNLPADDRNFPVADRFLEFPRSGVQRFILDSRRMRHPSPPSGVRGFPPDGSNLPWVVERMRTEDDERCRNWISHLGTALVDLEGISTVVSLFISGIRGVLSRVIPCTLTESATMDG